MVVGRKNGQPYRLESESEFPVSISGAELEADHWFEVGLEREGEMTLGEETALASLLV